MNNEEYNKRRSMVVFRIEHIDDEYTAFCAATQASDRFLCSGSLLEHGERLKLQVNVGGILSFAQAITKSRISAHDFSWIFSSCSKTCDYTDGMIDLYRDSRKVYAIVMAEGVKEDSENEWFDDYDDGRPSIYVINELFKMLSDADAVIEITSYGVSGSDVKYGQVLVSLPEEITLRIRSVLSMIFPKTVAVELSNESNCDNQDSNLTYKMLSYITRRIVYMKICQPVKKAEEDEDDIDDDNDERNEDHKPDDSDSVDSFDTCTPIDDLDLSVRAYNCLKRAGIDTIEKLKTKSTDDLIRVRNLGKKSMEEVLQKLSEFKAYKKIVIKPKSDYQAMLNELIGLKEVKEQFRKIAALAKMQHNLAEEGMPSPCVSLNMEFVGNPGTAKTTVARIAAGLLSEIGILKSDEIVEVGRADLVAKYVGHTAVKVKEVFEKAKGKLLFIDEAYSLLDGCRGEFGDEAINTIVQEIENNRNDTVVVFAGYPNDMEALFKSNPGLRSRVPFTIHFNDYNCEEMTQIVEFEAKKKGFLIDSEAIDRIKDICFEAAGQPNVGNGRFCRNLLENALISYASRVYENDDASCRNQTLISEDFKQIIRINQAQKPKIGFCA